MASIDKAIAERAAEQLGLFTTEQWYHLGGTWVVLDHRRRCGVLTEVTSRVLRVSAVPATWEQDVLAALLHVGDGAVVSHRTAAAIWGFDGAVRDVIEVTVARGHRPRPHPLFRLHTATTLPTGDTCEKRPFRLTTPARTLLDVAAVASYDTFETMADGAFRDRVVNEDRFRRRLGALRRSGRVGVAAAERLLGDERRPHSWLERQALRVLDAASVPSPRTQVVLRGVGRGARVDLFWDGTPLVVEVMGHGTHATRRRLQDDAERRARLELAGFRVVEFTYEDVVERPDYFVEMVLAHLRSVGAAA